MIKRTVIKGIGSFLPEKVVTNSDLAKLVDTSDDWIRERTGIKQRHFASEGQFTSDLAFCAAQRAIINAGINKSEIDLIIVATTTPDKTLPATAVAVQALLGIKNIPAFDIQAACSGFIYGLSIVDSFIKCGKAKNVLLIGAETLSRILDWDDRSTCVLFGDGAAAFICSSEESNASISDRGVISTNLYADGSAEKLLYADGGPSSTQTTGYIRMEGKEVFRHAVTNLTNSVKDSLKMNDITINDIDWMVPHQANKRILDATTKRLNFPPNKVIVTVDKHANTSAASIPLAMVSGVSEGLIKKDDLIIMEAMGAGFTWASALVRF
jgi:3-oxoacyl-[acyl-carrier-protein] synthase-3